MSRYTPYSIIDLLETITADGAHLDALAGFAVALHAASEAASTADGYDSDASQAHHMRRVLAALNAAADAVEGGELERVA